MAAQADSPRIDPHGFVFDYNWTHAELKFRVTTFGWSQDRKDLFVEGFHKMMEAITNDPSS